MKPEEIKLTDWTRIIFGQVPPEFYLELVIRALIVYILLMAAMRFIGKRMATQTSMLELTAMVSLASAIGVPMLAFDRGILPAIIITIIVVLITRGIARLSYKDQKFEQITQGDLDMLVEDGVMRYDIMQRVRISRERLLAHLRSECVLHLGKVKRLYMEANGSFSLLTNEDEAAGLLALPEWDKEYVSKKVKPTNTTICNNCGAPKQEKLKAINGADKCFNCGESEWTKAVTEA